MRRSAVLLVLSIVAATMVSLSVVPGTAWAGWDDLPEPTYEVQPGIGLVAVTGLTPGTTVNLHEAAFDPALEAWRVVGFVSAAADDAGTTMFRDLSPTSIYVTQVGLELRWFGVDRADRVPSPDLYTTQTLQPGYQYIEMRDGTLLSANVVLPGPPEDGPYPTVVEYSGYDPANPTNTRVLGALDASAVPGLCDSIPSLCTPAAQPGSVLAGMFGFAVVGVNVRGTGCSGGAYDFFDESQVADGYDVIETVAAQDWVKGNRVGMVGLSYPGISQLFVAKSNPPSLAAITPLSVYSDTGTGVSRPGGLLNTGFATSWAENVLRNAEPLGTGWVRQLVDEGDEVCEANQSLRGHNVNASQRARDTAFYTDEVAGPLDIRTWANDIEAAVFLASGWQDEQTGPSFGDLIGEFTSAPVARYMVYNGLHGDGFAPQILSEWSAFLQMYLADEVPDISPLVRSITPVFTEGIFGGTVSLPPDRWGGVSTAQAARDLFEAEDPVRVLMDNGAVDGAGLPVAAWEITSDVWPLADTDPQRFFLADGAALEPTAPAGESTASFTPDPNIGEVDFFGGSSAIWRANPDYNWVPAADGEAVTFETAPLEADMVMAGTASVDLFIRSTAPDADLEVILSELRPDGNESYVQAGQLRASYRQTDASSTPLQPVMYGRPDEVAPLVPGETTQVRIPIPDFAHTFRAGSAIRITVNTPGGDQPRWAYELLGLGAETTHTVVLGGPNASSVLFPVAGNRTAEVPLPACPSLRGQPCRPTPPAQ
jgi:predicted acyl esterase